MIVVITGVPGSGKTLYAIDWLRQKAEKENRPVYYDGIKDLKLPWHEHEATTWMDLPPNSIMLIDECQRHFRPRANGSVVPPFISEMETHRHLGIDLVLITQHPMLIDQNIRRLCGLHFHVVRKWGTHAATVHEWPSIKENCDKSRADSQKHAFKYPKDVFQLYKSAEVHTHKARIPIQVYILATVPILLSFIGYRLYSSFTQRAGEVQQVPSGAAPSLLPQARSVPPSTSGSTLNHAQYVEQFKPRVSGLAYTAPVYDEVTKPTRAPYPAACVQTKTRCQCYTQQGTRLETNDQLCGAIVAGGFFMAWDEKGQQVPHVRPVSDVPKLSGGNVDGLVNLTPGYVPPHAQSQVVAQAEIDGAGVRSARGERQ